MSELQKSFAKSHLSRLPPELHLFLDEREEEDAESDLPVESPDSSSSSASSTGTIVPSPSKKLFGMPKDFSRSRFSPLPWTDFFAQELYFDRRIDDTYSITHHAYLSPPTDSGPLFVTHHGAGSSGLSFATFTTEIQKLLPKAGVLSLDARGHGRTEIQDLLDPTLEKPIDLTLDTLSTDLAFVVKETQHRMSWLQLPDIILIGHSLGGAVATEVANKRLLGQSVLGYGVLDVVEGSALDALRSMENYLSTRPTSFPSRASGIEWHTRSRTIRNTNSARVSVPSLLIEDSPSPTTSSPSQWIWRTDLSATKPFWENWFVGLSKKFLESRGGKLLLLAGTDRLDKELIIGQMQGSSLSLSLSLQNSPPPPMTPSHEELLSRLSIIIISHPFLKLTRLTIIITGKYQLAVFPEAGHFVHEDQPAKTAQVVADFYRRNDRSALVLPPKVGDMLKDKTGHSGKGVVK